MQKYLLGIDNGGTYIKAALFDLQGNQICIAKQHNKVISPGPGMTEYNQDALWDINCQCMRAVIKQAEIDPSQIVSIGISAQGCGFYAIDREGKSIRNAITSADIRAQPQVERWEENGTNQRVYQRINRIVTSGQLNAILAWLRENEPQNYARIHRLFSMKDLLVYRLTGNAIAGYGCASASCLMDMKTKRIDPYLAESFGIGEMVDKFGPFYWDMEPCGLVSKTASVQCGCAPGTIVSAGSHDVVASALSMGITGCDRYFIIAGTHGINGYVSSAPIVDGVIKFNELFAFPDRYLSEEAYPSSAGVLEWVIAALFGHEAHKSENIYAEIDQMVMKVPLEEDCPIFLPFLSGNRNNPYACGSWDGLRNSHTRAHLLRAVFEGVVFSHKLQMEYLRRGHEIPEKVHLAGGVTNSPVWTQIFADILELQIEIVPRQEMSAKGAAICAAVAAGMYPNLEEAIRGMVRPGMLIYPRAQYAEIYRKRYDRFKQIVAEGNTIWTSPSRTGM